jgi:hypothetical protein
MRIVDIDVQVHDATHGRVADGLGHWLHDLLHAHGKEHFRIPNISYIKKAHTLL